MNANKSEELASWLETGEVEEIDLKESAAKLRKQQAEILAGKIMIKGYSKIIEEQKAEIEHLKGLILLLKIQVNGLKKASEK